MRENVAEFFKVFGLENVGFITLTFPDNVVSSRESSRRFNSFKTHYLNLHYPNWILVRERQKRGAWHYHMLVDYGSDIRTGFDFDALDNKKYKKISSQLRKSWTRLNLRAKRYGFGRCEGPIPIRTTVEQMAKYVAKYLAKGLGERAPEDKGVRLVSYSQKFRRRCASPTSWAWSGRSKAWRSSLDRWASVCGFVNFRQFKEVYGEKWAYRLSDYLFDLTPYSDADIKEIHQRYMNSDARAAEHFKNRFLENDNSDYVNPVTGELIDLSNVPF